jgi:hypothetical protein
MIVEAIAIGVCAGVLAGMFGIGGGVLFVPALTLLVGLGQVTAEGTSLLAMVPVGLVGAWSQHRKGLVKVNHAVTIGLLSAVGVFAGGVLAHHLPEDVLRKVFGVFLLLIASRLFARAMRERRGRLAGLPSESETDLGGGVR